MILKTLQKIEYAPVGQILSPDNMADSLTRKILAQKLFLYAYFFEVELINGSLCKLSQ